MKRLIFLALAGMSLTLGGCASMGSATRANDGFNADVDIVKVKAVNQWAETKGARVMWVNYPQKSKIAESTPTIN